MAGKVKDLSTARRKKGWSQKEIEAYAKRKSAEYKKVASKEEPDYLASGTQKSIEEICDDDDKERE